MKTGSAVLGIVGGAVALIIGVVAFFVGDIGQTLGIEGSTALQIISLALPIAALIGGGIAPRSGLLGGLLMLASAVGILIVLDDRLFLTYHRHSDRDRRSSGLCRLSDGPEVDAGLREVRGAQSQPYGLVSLSRRGR